MSAISQRIEPASVSICDNRCCRFWRDHV